MSTYRSILITGGAGFIGSHVVDAFAQAVADEKLVAEKIVVVDIFDYCASSKNLDHAKKVGNVIILQVDICDADAVRHVFETHDVDAVVHLAAQSHVDRSFGNSLAFTATNVCGTHTLLEVARQQWCKEGENMQTKKFLHISTDEVYGSCTDTQHRETTSLLQPTNPYAASKAAAEMYVESYRHSYGIPTIVSRSNNVYGPRQYPEKVIPKFILRLQSGLLPKIQGSGLQKRSFLYVTDVARALLLLFQKGENGGIYNIGSENEMEIRELAQVVTNHIQPSSCNFVFDHESDRPFNDQRYHLSTERIKTEIGWQPTVDFEKGLKHTIKWYAEIDHTVHWQSVPHDLFE